MGIRLGPHKLATAFILALAVFSSASVAAESPFEAPESLRVGWGVLMQPLLDSSVSSAVANPSINFHLGAGLVLPFASKPRWTFEPSADLYWYYCGYINSRAVPVEETLSDAFVIGLLVDAPFIYSFPISDKFAAGVGGGLCLNLRFAIDTPPYGNLESIYGYLWGGGRFVLPSIVGRFEYRLTERVECGLQLRALLPVFNLWTPDSPSIIDQAVFAATMTIRYRLH
jgi:hypothetical protein